MSPQDKQRLKATLTATNAMLTQSRAMLASPIPPAPPAPPMSPVQLQPALGVLQSALKVQADALEKLAKLVGDVIDAG